MPPHSPQTIFISYRREDSQAWAGRIADFLQSQTDKKVLIDVDSIERGVDYTKAIAQQISDADVVFVLVGRTWLEASDSEGIRRLEDPDDPVRVEVENALRQEKLVVPLLLDGASLPKRSLLPESIGDLAVRNGFSVGHESFRRDLPYLLDELDRVSGTDDRHHDAESMKFEAPSTARRAIATLIDLMPWIVAVMAAPGLKSGTSPADWVYWSGIALFLLAIGLTARSGPHRGQTFGKQMMGVQARGTRNTATGLRLFGRELVKYLWVGPTGTLSIGIIPTLYLHRTTRKSSGITWHDRATQTHVERIDDAGTGADNGPITIPPRFANQAALEEFASALNNDQFDELVRVLRLRGWTERELRDRVMDLRPNQQY